MNAGSRIGAATKCPVKSFGIKVQFSSIEQAAEDLQWRTDPFTPKEKTRLTEFLKAKFAVRVDSSVFAHEGFSRWALVWWVNVEV